MRSIFPSEETLRALVDNPDQGPVVMLNLIKFKRGGGVKAFGQYSALVTPLIEQRGGRVLYSGRAAELLAGDADWDLVVLVEYPSRRAFVDMFTSHEYQEAHQHREAALERTVLYATTPQGT